MGLKSHPLESLRDYLPVGGFELVLPYLQQHHIHLKLIRDRKTVLGDYRPPQKGRSHIITLNIGLNPWHLLITFIHELAHLITYNEKKHNEAPHGKTWQVNYTRLLSYFMGSMQFPEILQMALQESLKKVQASTCSDPVLYRVLQQFNAGEHQPFYVEELGNGQTFRTADGRRFQMISKRRTRYTCRELPCGRLYLFPSMYEVIPE